MAYGKMKDFLQQELGTVREAGLYKEERYILGEQAAGIKVEYPEGAKPEDVLNFCANNYLGLSSHPEVMKASKEGLDNWGFGMSSVPGAEDRRVSRHGRRNPVFVMLRRERRTVRGVAYQGRLHRHGQAQPRISD